jgi:hypothetical protein
VLRVREPETLLNLIATVAIRTAPEISS